VVMADADSTTPLSSSECREPVLEDLAALCQALNRAGAHYVVIGGFAMRAAGFIRSTMDIDLLIETGLQNEQRVIEALMTLPDKAVREVKPGEVEEYGVVRVADEFLVDLMKSGCGVMYAEACRDAAWQEVQGIRIPFASPQTLWRMKQTPREKDIPDRLFLRKLLEARGVPLAPPDAVRLPGWLQRLKLFLSRGTRSP
jgi:hypothetical protein